MVRNCRKFDISPFIENNQQFKNCQTSIYIDEANYSEIYSFLTEKKLITGKFINIDKFYRILYEILSNHYNIDLYAKEEMSEKTKNITAMKFKGRKNIRLYCKEITFSGKRIVIVCLHQKKVQANDKRIKALLESIAEYEYVF